ARAEAIEALLQSLAGLTSQTYITPQELAASHRSIAPYGLDSPVASLTLHSGPRRTEILFGSKTPAGDRVYVQLLTKPGIYVLDWEIYDRLPRSHRACRDHALPT